MEYYKMRCTFDLAVIGAIPQAPYYADFVRHEQLYYLDSIGIEPVPPNVQIPPLKMQAKARFTDLMSHTLPLQLMVSGKLKAVICSMQVYGCEWLPAVLIKKGKENTDYFYIHPARPFTAALDMEKSTFSYYDWSGKKRVSGELKFDSGDAFDNACALNLRNALAADKPVQPLLNNCIIIRNDIDTDFFLLTNTLHEAIAWCVSARLREKIEAAGCTGIVFAELNSGL